MSQTPPRQQKGQPTGGQFAPKNHSSPPAEVALDDQDGPALSERMSELFDTALGDGFAIGAIEDGGFKIFWGYRGTEYALRDEGDSFRVTGTDSSGREHHASRRHGSGEIGLEEAVSQVRKSVYAAESLSDAVSAIGPENRTNFAGASFTFDHDVYGDTWALQVDGGDDGYFVAYALDPRTDEMTDQVAVFESGDTAPMDPQDAAEVLKRATGIDNPDQALEFCDKVGRRALEIHARKNRR